MTGPPNGFPIEFEAHPQGIVLPVQAQPGARQNGVTGVHGGRLKVSVTQAPEKGKANQALAKVLADALGVKKSQVELLAGATSGAKKFLVVGLTVDALHERIARLL
jgi:uncharacterized protein (TIGR00251 family)